MKIRLSLLMVVLSVPVLAQFDAPKGWYWYEDTEIEQAPEPLEAPKKELTAQDIIKQQGEQHDKALAEAVINPTPENVKAYLEISKMIHDQAGEFAMSFKKTIWQSPEFDRSVTARPSGGQALMVYQQDEHDSKNNHLKAIAQDNGILYFFRSDCQFCTKFSPILKQFSATFGFTVIPISLDGKGSPSYPNPKTSHHMASQLNVSAVPATFLVNPSQNTVSAISYGFADWSLFGDKLVHANSKLEQSTITGSTP